MGSGTNPVEAGLRATIWTSMPTARPWSTTLLLKPWSTSAVRTVPAGATLFSSAVPIAFSCTDAATTTTAMISPVTSTASPRRLPGVFLAASRPVVALGTATAARTVCEPSTTGDGSPVRPALSRTIIRSTSLIRASRPSRFQTSK